MNFPFGVFRCGFLFSYDFHAFCFSDCKNKLNPEKMKSEICKKSVARFVFPKSEFFGDKAMDTLIATFYTLRDVQRDIFTSVVRKSCYCTSFLNIILSTSTRKFCSVASESAKYLAAATNLSPEYGAARNLGETFTAKFLATASRWAQRR